MKTLTCLRVELPSPSPADVAPLCEKLTGFCRDMGICDSRFLNDLELLAAEALNNAIEHGCAGIAMPDIRFEACMEPHRMVLEIEDPSGFLGMPAGDQLPEDPLSESGRGMFLISALSDSHRHVLRAGRHCLVMEKKLPAGSTIPEPGEITRILEGMTEEVGSSYEMINALIGLGEMFAGSEEIEGFLEVALKRLCELTGAEASYIRMDGPQGLILSCLAGNLEFPPLTLLEHEGDTIESRVFQTGEEITVTGVLPGEDPLCRLCSAAFVAPIIFKSRRTGVLVLLQKSPGLHFFSAGQLQLARVVGEYLGIATAISELQARRQHEQRALRELEIAAEIQMALMPQTFSFRPDLDIYGVCRPASKAGGDYFDVIDVPGGGVLLACADVMGKGISAALVANMLRTAIRGLLSMAHDPGALIRSANTNLEPDLRRLEMFITLACVYIPKEEDQIREASAGHPTGRILKTSGNPVFLHSHGLPLGILPDTTYENEILAFEPGDALILYSDGIPEAADPQGRFFETMEMPAFLSRPPAPARTLVSELLAAVDAFTSFAQPTDDRTVLAVRRNP